MAGEKLKHKFWVVWNETGNQTFKHDCEESARKEAERLTILNGGFFHVLELVGTCTLPPRTIWEDAVDPSTEIPF